MNPEKDPVRLTSQQNQGINDPIIHGHKPAHPHKWYMDRGIQSALIGGFFTILAGIMGIIVFSLKTAPTTQPVAIESSTEASTAREVSIGISPDGGIVAEEFVNEEEDGIESTIVGLACPKKGQNFEYNENETYARGSGTIVSKDGLVITGAQIFGKDSDLHNDGCFVLIPKEDGQLDVYEAKIDSSNDLYDKFGLTALKISDTQGRKIPWTEMSACEKISNDDELVAYGLAYKDDSYKLVYVNGEVEKIEKDKIKLNISLSDWISGALATRDGNCVLGITSIETTRQESNPYIIPVKKIEEFLEKVN